EDFFADLLTSRDIDFILNSNKLRFPATNLIGGKLPKLEPGSFTRAENVIDAGRVFKYYAEGYTIALSGLHEEFHKLGLLCDHMVKQLSHRFQTNIYCTPKDSQGFNTHYDSHDVFVLQVHGEKKWQIYDCPIQLPLKNFQEFNKDVDYHPTLRTEVLLQAGDFLYIPRGMMHNAHTEDQPSIHITLGMLGTTYLDLLTEILKENGKLNQQLREYLPIGYTFDEQAQKQLLEQVGRIQAELKFSEPAEKQLHSFRNSLLKNSRGKQLHQLQNMDALDTLNLDTYFMLRENVLYHLSTVGDKVVLHFSGYEHSFPEEARELLEAILEKKEFKGSDLPDDFDEESQLNMLKYLMKEGILTLAR
ncbi:MAG: cupin domain-containing protein, partial [Bacteroidetes bacterium]|nr:cupin domain-containing protein [Bacteroidota bacterium]